LELSWGGFWLSEWMGFVALSIYAFDVGGARALGALGVVRMAPAALTLPFAGMLNDRYPRHRVLLGINLVRAGALGATAVALAAPPRLRARGMRCRGGRGRPAHDDVAGPGARPYPRGASGRKRRLEHPGSGGRVSRPGCGWGARRHGRP